MRHGWSVTERPDGYDLLSWQPGRVDDPNHIPALAADVVRVADLMGR